MAEREVIYRVKIVDDPGNKAVFDAMAERARKGLEIPLRYGAPPGVPTPAGVPLPVGGDSDGSQSNPVPRAPRKPRTPRPPLDLPASWDFDRLAKHERESAANREGWYTSMAKRGGSDGASGSDPRAAGAKAAQQAEQALAAAQQQSAAVSAAAHQQMQSRLRQSLSAVTQLARGFVLLGVSGEENIVKAAKALAAFEGVVAIAHGASTLAAMGRGRGAGGGPGLGGYTGGAAAAVGVQAAHSMAGSSTAVAAAPWVAAAGAVAALVGSTKLWSETLLRSGGDADSWTQKLTGVFEGVAKWWSNNESKLQDRADKMADNLAKLNAAEKDYTSAVVAVAREQLKRANITEALHIRDTARQPGPNATTAEKDLAANTAVAANERILELLKERLQLAKETSREEIATARERVRAIDHELDQQRSILKNAQDAMKTQALRYASLSTFERQESINAAKKAKGGGQLSDSEREALRRVGGEPAEKADLDLARREGAIGLFSKREQAQATEAAKRVETLTVKLQAAQKLEVQYVFDFNDLEAQLTPQIKSIGDKIQAAALSVLERQKAALENEYRRQLNNNPAVQLNRGGF